MSQSSPPPKTLVLLFDGTGNFFKKENTNVIRLFAGLENNEPEKQLLYYQPGIGTYVSPTTFWAGTFRNLAKLADKALACFLSDHVVKGYHFLMQHYRKGDRICLFGFSRGAYTARALAGMLHKVGLLPIGNEEQLPFAWKHYRDSSDSGREQAEEFKYTFSRDIDISFVGVWDTVASVGLLGLHLGYTRWNPSILTFRHAVSLDEHRTRFQPNPCGTEGIPKEKASKSDTLSKTTESNAAGPKTRKINKGLSPLPDTNLGTPNTHNRHSDVRFNIPDAEDGGSGDGPVDEADQEHATDTQQAATDPHLKTDHKEVWFAGCHSDVGGGSVGVASKSDANLANVSLGWMVKEAILAKAGLHFREDAFRSYPGVWEVVGPYILAEEEGTLDEITSVPIDKAHPEASNSLILELAGIFGFDLSDVAVKDQADALHNKWLELQESSEGVKDKEKTPNTKIEQLKMEQVVVRDACSVMRDQLSLTPGWWILEWIPLVETRVHHEGYVRRRIRWNRGRARVIPKKEENLLHSSVLVRQCVLGDYRPKAIWEGSVHFVD